MKVIECMTRDVHLVSPDDTLQSAARTMAKIDAGILPVGEGEKLVGMITDRDIAIRGVGAGRAPNAHVRDVMTTEVKYCFEDQETDEVLENMGDLQLRRMPVVDSNKRLVGILSISDAAQGEEYGAAQALIHVTRSSGQHSQML